ncbi:MAG: N-acetylneuraminate synthase [Acidobacteria bacterium]|nr:N-acetylneuraminate synthase [Acidobacteriota bacterium]
MISSRMTLSFGPGVPGTFLIAEVAQAHDGSLGTAHSFIDCAADAGADAVKFQTHIAAAESTADEPFRVPFSMQDADRTGYWARTGFDAGQWRGLAERARERGLHFLSSPFSVEAVRLLAEIGVPAWKVGSGEVRSHDLLQAMLDAGGPILLSTGMSGWDDIDETVRFLREREAEIVVMQCTSRYPTPLSAVGLNVLDEMARRYDCPVGLSDHSGTPYPALSAIARGVSVVEVHVTLHRGAFGPDVPASVTFEELALLSRARDAFAELVSNPVDKDAMAASLSELRTTFGKSVAPARALPAGTVLERGMLAAKKPGSGIPVARLESLLGRRLARDVRPDRLLRLEDLEASDA